MNLAPPLFVSAHAFTIKEERASTRHIVPFVELSPTSPVNISVPSNVNLT